MSEQQLAKQWSAVARFYHHGLHGPHLEHRDHRFRSGRLTAIQRCNAEGELYLRCRSEFRHNVGRSLYRIGYHGRHSNSRARNSRLIKHGACSDRGLAEEVKDLAFEME